MLKWGSNPLTLTLYSQVGLVKDNQELVACKQDYQNKNLWQVHTTIVPDCPSLLVGVCTQLTVRG